MCGKKVSLLFFLFACYTEVTFGMDTEPVTQCRTDDECIILTECKSYMNFISSFEKPLKSPVVKFLRKKQCGFEGGFPKVCCPDISKLNFAATQLKSNYKMCKKKECMSLKDCRPYMDLIKKMEKPMKPLVVEFLRAQQCGFQEDYPMVCCSLLPKNFKILKHARPDSRPIDFKEHNQLSSIEFDLRDVFNKIQTTTKPSVSDREKIIREKAEAINNEFDLSDFFDFTGSFDLLRRRRRFNNGSEFDIEIR